MVLSPHCCKAPTTQEQHSSTPANICFLTNAVALKSQFLLWLYTRKPEIKSNTLRFIFCHVGKLWVWDLSLVILHFSFQHNRQLQTQSACSLFQYQGQRCWNPSAKSIILTLFQIHRRSKFLRQNMFTFFKYTYSICFCNFPTFGIIKALRHLVAMTVLF